RRTRSGFAGLPRDVLLRRARRGHPLDQEADRGDLRRRLHRHGLHRRDVPVDDRRGVLRARRHAPLAGPRLHRGLRSEDLPASALRRATAPHLPPPRPPPPADDPLPRRRPAPLDRRALRLRKDVPAPAAGNLRAHRRHVHRAWREHLSLGDRGRATRHRRIRRRVPRNRLPARGDGRSPRPRGDLSRARRCRGGARDPGSPPGPAGRAAAAGAGRAGHDPADRVQGEAGDRRSRPLPPGRLQGADMSDEKEKARARRVEWEGNELREFRRRQPESKERYETASGIPVHRVYTPEDAVPFEEIGLPGQFPFTRGPYPTMYRGRNWTMRQIAGFGTGEDTNRRFRYLIEQGQTGLSVDFDMPTLMGYDSDDPRSLGEVGREGVAVCTLDDMEALFEGIDLTRISVSMTINPTAWILLAMYVALAQSRGYDLNSLSGTVQADILKEYMAQKE